MEIRNLCLCIVVNCAIIPFSSAKTFSLNKALAEETKLKPPLSLSTAESYTNKKQHLQNFNSREHNEFNDFFSLFNLRTKPFKKREIHRNDKIDTKYFPLLRNLGFMLDNLFNNNPYNSFEANQRRYQRHKIYQPERRLGRFCKCALETDTETGESGSSKKTALLTTPISIQTATNTTPKTYYSSLGKHSNQRQIKNIPLLLPRNPRGNRRNSNGYSERNSSAFHRSIQGDITRVTGNPKYFSRIEKEHGAGSNAKTAHSSPRNGTSGNEYRRQLHRGYAVPSDRTSLAHRKKVARHGAIYAGVPYEGNTGDTKLKDRGNETKREKLLPKHVRRFGRIIPSTTKSNITESIQSKKTSKESFEGITHTDTSNKQIINRNSTIPTKIPRTSSYGQMISIEELNKLNLAFQKSNRTKANVVSIIDGYSKASHKNA